MEAKISLTALLVRYALRRDMVLLYSVAYPPEKIPNHPLSFYFFFLNQNHKWMVDLLTLPSIAP